MDLHQLPPSPSPGLVNLIVEIPAGSRNKYEYSAEAGVMVLCMGAARVQVQHNEEVEPLGPRVGGKGGYQPTTTLIAIIFEISDRTLFLVESDTFGYSADGKVMVEN